MNKVESEVENKEAVSNQVDPEMIKAAFDFWFNSNEHVRSPFPEYIRKKLQVDATNKFINWNAQVSDKARKDINDEILAEKFEEIMFELALEMVFTEDEKLTVRYPFMLRINDIIQAKDGSEEKSPSIVIDRWYEKRGDFAFMKVKLENTSSGEKWETEFELPE